jgi:hypothetical protein
MMPAVVFLAALVAFPVAISLLVSAFYSQCNHCSRWLRNTHDHWRDLDNGWRTWECDACWSARQDRKSW